MRRRPPGATPMSAEVPPTSRVMTLSKPAPRAPGIRIDPWRGPPPVDRMKGGERLPALLVAVARRHQEANDCEGSGVDRNDLGLDGRHRHRPGIVIDVRDAVFGEGVPVVRRQKRRVA